MKTFRYKHGRIAGETVTVAELMEILKEYPGDMPVMATWEGVYSFITPNDFCTELLDERCAEDRELCLVIDVDL